MRVLTPVLFQHEGFFLNFDESIDGVRVRRGTLADVRAIAALDLATLGRYARPVLVFRQALDADPSSLFVAEMNGLIAGYCLSGRSSSSNAAWIFSVGVSQEFRRKGLGLVLVRSALDYLAVNEAFFALASVDVENVAALGLFEGLGFERAAIEHDYFSDGVARVKMSRKL